MKIKQTILVFALSLGMGGILSGTVVSAATCGGVNTSVVSCDQNGGGYCPNNPEASRYLTKDQVKNGALCDDGSKPDAVAATGVWGILLLIINIMTAGIGVLAVGGVVYGSVLYATASDSMEQKKKGKITIFNVVLGIVIYGLMYAFLNYIVPGGLFN